jgi:hypothetical protein
MRQFVMRFAQNQTISAASGQPDPLIDGRPLAVSREAVKAGRKATAEGGAKRP